MNGLARAAMGSLAGALIAALAGCGPSAAPSAKPAALAAPAAPTAPAAAAPASCHEQNAEADLRCTPGVRNPQVTQLNIHSTICRSGWTKTVRPPVSYTDPIKRADIAAYGLPGAPADYELDHLIPLELGGDPTDPHNLWPEPWAAPHGAHAKDQEENSLHRAVCGGGMSLSEAQDHILRHWAS